jgi:hypothetical protein
MAEVVFDATLLVALLYQADDRLEREGDTFAVLDFFACETVSVVCRTGPAVLGWVVRSPS